jgi:nucleoside-diphosphate-sugar epimerase
MIGSAIQAELAARGIACRTLGRSEPEGDGPKHLVGSTTDPEMVSRLLDGATVLFHLARTTHDLQDMCKYDYPAMATILPAAIQRDVEVHFTSSQMVHDCQRAYPIETVDEDFPFRPYDPYGAMKLAWERTLICCRKTHGLDYVTYRFPTVIRPDFGPDYFAARYLNQGLDSGVISPQDDNERFGGRCIIHAEQIAKVMVDNIGKAEAFGMEFMLCCDGYLRHFDLAVLSAEILRDHGHEARVEWDTGGEPAPGFMTERSFSNAKAKRYLGFEDDGGGLLRQKLCKVAARF